jgi:hypothetical protein
VLGKRGWVGGLGEELEKCVEANETYDLSFRISHSAAAGGSRWCSCCATRKWGLRKEFDAETLCRITTLLARRRSRAPEISRLLKGGVKRVSASVGRNPAGAVRARYLAAPKPLRRPRDDKEVIDSRVLGQHPIALGKRARVPLPRRETEPTPPINPLPKETVHRAYYSCPINVSHIFNQAINYCHQSEAIAVLVTTSSSQPTHFGPSHLMPHTMTGNHLK